MRIDFFLPFLKKAKKGVIQTPTNWLSGAARAVLPAALFADLQTGKPGLIRRFLKWVGPTWVSAPMRRVVQGICLAAFLILFFYVCWPYTARPTRSWQKWVAAETDVEAKTVKFLRGDPEANPPGVGETLYLVDTSLPAAEGAQQLPYEVVAAAEKELTLKTAAELPAEGLAPGPWMLHENPPGSWPAHYTHEPGSQGEDLRGDLFDH